MAERNLDFDTIIDRKNTNSLKYDFAIRRGKPADVLPLWVADMDFKVSSYIQDAIVKAAEHGIFGYSETKEEYFEIVRKWMKKHYDWEVSERWLIKTPGIVFALAMAVKAYTQPGDGVLICQPVYYPFSEVITDNGRRIVDSTLTADENGRYQIDFEDFEKKIVDEKVKLFLLCNPHNPVGRVWSRKELETIGDICKKHGVIVVSDEIHADFSFSEKHLVFADVKEEYKDFSVVCTSPTKTFNIAGLQISNIFIPNQKLRRLFKDQVNAAGYSQVNTFGIVACEAAYENGEEWLEGVLRYIQDNIAYLKEYIDKNIPKLSVREPEGTYLVWIDFRKLGLSGNELENLIVKKAGLWLDSGAIFGPAGEGYQRINVACPRKTLTEALDRIRDAVEE
ncbi:MAG: pyridoxal phosphate-dependent aminotransferase [Thermoflexaceae bacterium]|nr:pyridoxal phosphate-dependent aminotransferase [Thermoflexaceae bacterium]